LSFLIFLLLFQGLASAQTKPATQAGDFELPLWEFGLSDTASIGAEDLLSGATFQWHGKRQHLRLDPQTTPCAIWRLTPIPAKT